MSIVIASRQLSCELAAGSPGKYNIVSILEPDLLEAPKDVQKHAKSYLPLFFHDIEYKREGYVEPQPKHVEAVLQWADGKDDLVVACQAGISRSSATAYLIQCTREVHPKLALNILKPLKHYPNALIVKIGSSLLKNDAILDEYYKWLNNRIFSM